MEFTPSTFTMSLVHCLNPFLSNFVKIQKLQFKYHSTTTRALTIFAPGPWFVRKIIGQDICHCVESTVVDAQSKSMQLIGFKNYWNYFMMKADTQVSLFRNKTAEHNTIVVCFRGTRPFSADDWCSGADLSWYEFNGIGRIHSGFLKALGMQKSLKFNPNNRLAYRLESKDREALIASRKKHRFRSYLGDSEDVDIVALKNYMDAQYHVQGKGLPLFWIGVGVGLSALFTWVASSLKVRVLSFERLPASPVCTMLFYILIYSSNGTERCVVHRDIKPSNILLSSKKTPKVCRYLAPEYFQHGKVHDKIDVYAFGVILLELITGRKPIEARRPPGEEKLVFW
ncbi:hypothetical protein F3Y22_tig00110260pilonHSYRG00054 [Hibiscus syriacus]|uniref:Protein kinase domain-containing protein n=1 Tax=Hibiscus syriacus TaxID=106335 RepID=A0A6A3B5Y8_HIBSY|nr:hypothetical protein F3Y22_tig00110260pilonHSYRG00054 [Hibiscus syriacus]